MNLSTHRITQPSSFPSKLLDVKSLTQSLKQRCTRLEYICGWDCVSLMMFGESETGLIRRRTFMKSFICFRSIRFCSSRCSVGVSLGERSVYGYRIAAVCVSVLVHAAHIGQASLWFFSSWNSAKSSLYGPVDSPLSSRAWVFLAGSNA